MTQALRSPMSTKPIKKDAGPMAMPMIFIGFALLSFITSFFMNGDSSVEIKDKISIAGGTLGPIKVKEDNSVFELNARQRLDYGTWSNVTGEVLNEKKESLFSFGKELWAQEGYDSEGSWWGEKETKVSTKFTIKKAGTYYIKFTSEDSGGVYAGISILVSRKRGSSLPHLVAGIIALLIGVILYYIRSDLKFSEMGEDIWDN